MKFFGLVTKKVGMTRVLDRNGNMIAVTLLSVPNQVVTKICSKEHNGYEAVQLGYDEKAEKNLTKPDIGRLRKASVNFNFSTFREVRVVGSEAKLGEALTLELLSDVEFIDATGFTKGRGFTGSVKRWNTACGRMTHGSRFHRRPGSLGTRTTPGRVFKGKPVHGRYGNERVTMQKLQIVDIDKDLATIAIKGSIPGHRNGTVLIRPTVKR